MKILSVNAGSSSLKFTLFELPSEKELISGTFEKIGISDSFYTIKINGEKKVKDVYLADHSVAVKYLMEELLSNNVISKLEEIDGIGHRIVQGGSIFKETVLVDSEVIKQIEDLSELAPLHNPAHVMGLKAFREALPNVPMTVVFDTAFHQTMKKTEYIYPVPYEWYEKYQIRKYGFHGTSHRYITKTISQLLNRDDLKIISCHLGNGSSITAIKNGKVVDTSMGLTPLAGLMMGTRCGDIDVSIIPYIMKKENLTIDEVWDILNKKSGFLGVSGVSSDSRDIADGIAKGNDRCVLAEEQFERRVVDFIAKYYVLLGGADVICFAGGIGENGIDVRSNILNKLSCLGVVIDEDKNNCRGKLTKITKDDSKIACYVVPTNEELMIARDTYAIINE